MTKATDLKTKFLKSPWKMDVDTCVTLWYLFKTKTKKSLHFFDLFCHFFLSLPSNQTIKVIDLFYFNEILGFEHFNPIQKLNFSKMPFVNRMLHRPSKAYGKVIGFCRKLKIPPQFPKSSHFKRRKWI